MPRRRLLLRISGEAALIVVSVFVAIFLESLWQDRMAQRDARQSLAQVQISLIEDRAFYERVEKEQRAAEAMIAQVMQWFASPASLPHEQVHEVLANYSMPVSIWPRRAAWDTMVNAGQLQLLNAPALTTRIGDYYEHHLTRIEYNGRQYDDLFAAVFENDMPRIWDLRQRRPLTTDPDQLSHFYNRLLLSGWTAYYLEFVDSNRLLLDSLIADIDQYLQASG